MIIKTQLSDGNFAYEYLNLNIPYEKNSREYQDFIEDIIITMDQNFESLFQYD